MKTESQHRAIIMKGHMYWTIFTSFILQRCQLLHGVQNINGTITCGNLTCSVKSYCEDLGLNGSRCMCVPGYMGVGCFEDKDECSTSHENLCLYRGDCINTVGSFICKCLDGWNNTGHCETPIDVAENRKCIPGHMGDLCFDTCINDTMCEANQLCKTTHQGPREGKHCTCKPGWTSSNTRGSFTCEPHSSEQAGGNTDVQKGRIIGAVVGSLTGIALIAVIVLIVKYRWMHRCVTDNDPLKSKDECIHEEPKNVSYRQDSL